MAQWLQVLAALTKDRVGSQHLHGGSQLPVAPVPGHLAIFS